MGSYKLKLHYLLFLVFSMGMAFFAFRHLVKLSESAGLDAPILFMNTVVLMVLWFFSFTSNHKFIQENFLTVVAIPFMALTGGNLILAFTLTATGVMDFYPFIIASGLMLLGSHRTSVYEKRLREE